MQTKDTIPSLRYITDFEGNYDTDEYESLPQYAQDLVRKVQTEKTSDYYDWKSYVVERSIPGMPKDYCMTLESFFYTSAQAEDTKVPQAYLNKRVRADVDRLKKRHNNYKAEVYLTFDEMKDPTIIILLPEIRSRELLLMFATASQGCVRYDLENIVNGYNCTYAV